MAGFQTRPSAIVFGSVAHRAGGISRVFIGNQPSALCRWLVSRRGHQPSCLPPALWRTEQVVLTASSLKPAIGLVPMAGFQTRPSAIVFNTTCSVAHRAGGISRVFIGNQPSALCRWLVSRRGHQPSCLPPSGLLCGAHAAISIVVISRVFMETSHRPCADGWFPDAAISHRV